MGSEKAFLLHDGRTFISAIAAQVSKVSDNVIVMTREKDVMKLRPFLADDVDVFQDDRYLSNPLGGIMSGLEHVEHAHVALAGCDAPLVKAEVIKETVEAISKLPQDAYMPVLNRISKFVLPPSSITFRTFCARKSTIDLERRMEPEMLTVFRMPSSLPGEFR